MLRGATLITSSLLLVTGLWINGSTAGDRPFPNGQRHYLESCGGCHGLDGGSLPSNIPVLKERVGSFLCTAAGRRYIIQLPNVAFANMDDQSLADAMNFVVFGLGGNSTPAYAKPYTAREVGELRHRPLKNTPVTALREKIVEDALERCNPNDKQLNAYPKRNDESGPSTSL